MRLNIPLSSTSLESDFSSWVDLTDLDLEVPSELGQLIPFCVEGPLLQHIASASRKRNNKLRLKLYDLDVRELNFPGNLSRAIGNLHVICSWLLSSKVTDKNGVEIPKNLSVDFVKYLDAMDSFEFLETHQSAHFRVNLVCVQGAIREYIRPLYERSDVGARLRPYQELRILTQDILAQLAPKWTGRELREMASGLAQLLKELVENADNWATSDEFGQRYEKGKSFRVVSFRLIDLANAQVSDFGGNNSHLQSYLQKVLASRPNLAVGASRPPDRPVQSINFIEMTVVDTGPGIVRRWLSSRAVNRAAELDINTIDLASEEDAIAQCFVKWRTASNQKTRGVGLFSVAQMLKEKNGFLRLRTGRLDYLYGTESAQNDVFSKVKIDLKKNKQDYVKLSDGTHVFSDNSNIDFFLRPWAVPHQARVEGTSFSILLPVES